MRPYAIRPAPLGHSSGGYPFWSHSANVAASRKWFRVKCSKCDFGGSYMTRPEARDAADAHEIYTHVSGGHECGNAHCHADLAIRRIQRRAAVTAVR